MAELTFTKHPKMNMENLGSPNMQEWMEDVLMPFE